MKNFFLHPAAPLLLTVFHYPTKFMLKCSSTFRCSMGKNCIMLFIWHTERKLKGEIRIFQSVHLWEEDVQARGDERLNENHPALLIICVNLLLLLLSCYPYPPLEILTRDEKSLLPWRILKSSFEEGRRRWKTEGVGRLFKFCPFLKNYFSNNFLETFIK